MMGELDRDEQMALAMAMLQLNLAGVESASEMLANPELRKPSITRIREQVDGMTADEIVALAARSSDVTMFVQGEEPGIAPELLTPLESGPVSRSLAGTTWIITSDINGHTRHSVIRLDAGGKAHSLDANANPAQANTWEQSGGEFRLSLNDQFVIYRGRLDGDVLGGTAGNTNGSQWTWTAEETTSSH